VLWRTTLGNSFGEPLWGAALANCPEQLSGTGATFYKQLRGAAFNSNFREQLSGAALQNRFGAVLGYRFEELQLWGYSFGQQLLVANLGRSF